MAYEVLERDEKGYATHTIEDGVEDWTVNYYTPEGKFKDLRIIHMRVPPGYRCEWFNKVYPNGYDLTITQNIMIMVNLLLNTLQIEPIIVSFLIGFTQIGILMV